MSKNSVEIIDINPTLRVRIEYDNDSGGPGECPYLFAHSGHPPPSVSLVSAVRDL